jgi:hypothetical protein
MATTTTSMTGPGIEWNLRFARRLAELDRFGLQLAHAGHSWTAKQRKTYESCVRELKTPMSGARAVL